MRPRAQASSIPCPLCASKEDYEKYKRKGGISGSETIGRGNSWDSIPEAKA
jgi:hypothetical protein